MIRTFDYKVILIIFLSITLYLLYRNIEKLEKRVNLLERKNEPIKNPIQLPLPEPQEDNVPQLVEIESESEEYKNLNFEEFVHNDNIDTVKIDFNINKDININNEVNSEQQNILEAENNDENNNNDDNNNDTLEEFSNEMEASVEENVQIYSNDNEDDELESSLMESLVEAVDDTNDKLNSLLKNNKLPELQQKAEELNINLIKENLKKKTKLELAKEILSKNN